MPELRIGTSGWSYNDWDGELYPPGLPPGRRRDVYAQHFDTVELNASYYRWPPLRSFQTWGRVFPQDFRLTVKASKYLTHYGRLRNPEAWSERLGDAWQALGSRAGIYLVQLHPAHERDDAVLEHLLSALPRQLRVAVEFRHPSWHCDEVQEILRRHDAAYVVMSGANLPCHLWATTDFVYIRFHGPDQHRMYSGSYSDQDLGWWTDRCLEWLHAGRSVWAYFNNDYDANAVRNARTLRAWLGSAGF